MTNKKNILEKINIDIQNSNKVITNPYYFEFSKLQIFIYNLLNIKIIFSFIKFFIKIAKYLEFVINTKNLILTKLDPNISSKLNKKKSLKINHELNQEYGYDEFSEIKRFYTNVKIVNTKNNAGLFFDRINYSVNETVKIINLDQNIKKLKSVGCSYAHFENIIAQKFKKIKVECFDRSEITAILNKKEFPLSNINFFFGDIIDFVSKQDSDYSIFNHMFTLVYLPKDLVEELYFQLKKNNTKYIILAERVGISRETGKMYKFDFRDLPSVRFRNNMFIHNYPGILKKYGYSIESLDVIEVPEIKKEYMLKIVAKNITM
jgi:hypothetical protein